MKEILFDLMLNSVWVSHFTANSDQEHQIPLENYNNTKYNGLTLKLYKQQTTAAGSFK